jgi:hypothetical protein
LRASRNEIQRLRPPKNQRIAGITSKGKPLNFTREGDGCVKFQSETGVEYKLTFE